MSEEKRIQDPRTMPYEEYLLTPEWQEKRKQVLDHAKHRCQICNSSESLNVHHRTYERRGNEDLADLTVLCKNCHSQFHDRVSAQERKSTFSTLLEIAEETSNSEQSTGLSTGYDDLDLILGSGLHRSDLILLGGRTRNGKTAFALNIARNVAVKYDKKVAIFSLEMSKQQIFERFISMEAQIDTFSIRNGYLTNEDEANYLAAAETLLASPLWISDVIGTVDAIRQELRQLLTECVDIDLVIIDYLGLIEPYRHTKGVNAEQQVRAISRGLKLLAREFSVPVLVLCQLSRAAESRTSKRPELTDLRDSGAQEQDADVVLLIHCDDVYDPDTERAGLADIIVAKQRNGPIGEVTVFFKKEYMLLQDLAITPPEIDTQAA